MAWFKNTAGDNASMSSTNFDKRASRDSFPDPRLAEFALKSPLASTPAARAEMKPAVEVKPAEVKPAEVKPAEIKPAAEPRPVGSVFGPSLRFKGELRADEDFVMQGRIEGSIHHTQNLTIGTDGVVKGDSRARNIIVDGTIEGDLYALESISIRPTAKVQGNLMAPRVSIADGASFNGKIDMATAARAARSIADRHATPPQDTASLDDGTAEHVLLSGGAGE
jgi:cytoskeletal protein CcmA (bactofilin family)